MDTAGFRDATITGFNAPLIPGGVQAIRRLVIFQQETRSHSKTFLPTWEKDIHIRGVVAFYPPFYLAWQARNKLQAFNILTKGTDVHIKENEKK